MWKSFKRALVGDPISSEQAQHERLNKKTALAVFLFSRALVGGLLD